MLYKKSYSVPIGTTATDPDRQKLQVSKGLLNQWIVWMTEESSDYLHLRVEYHGFPVYPFSPDQSIYAWFKPIGISDNLKIDTPPYELDIISWNTAPTNSHEYHVHCNIEPKKPAAVGVDTYGIFENIKGFLGVE